MTRRSVLFSPGDRPELMRKAPRTDADVLVFDLEDAVAPGRKEEARAAVCDLLSDGDFDPDAEVCVRVNAGDAAVDDLDGVLATGAHPDALMVPKATSADDVERVATLARERGVDLPVFALVETAAGVLAAPAVAAAADTTALVFGAEDFAADVGATRTDEGTEILYARERVVVAAGAAGVDALDTVYTDFDDTAGLREETAFAATLGYDGKLAIHPSQVAPINEAFTPDEDEIAWARRVVDAAEAAADDDRGVVEVDGEMVDAPLLEQARRTLRRAAAAGEI